MSKLKETLQQDDDSLQRVSDKDFFKRQNLYEEAGSFRPRFEDDAGVNYDRYAQQEDYQQAQRGFKEGYSSTDEGGRTSRTGQAQQQSSAYESPRNRRHHASAEPHVRHDTGADDRDSRQRRYANESDRDSTSGRGTAEGDNQRSWTDGRTDGQQNLKREKNADRLDNKADKLRQRRLKELKAAPKEKRLRIGQHEKLVTDRKTGEKIAKKRFGVYKKTRTLREGERNTRQRLIYQAGHTPKEWIKREFEKAEYQEGNEAVQIAHTAETKLKEKVLKPFVRKHLPFGFDYHQHKAFKLGEKEKLTRAKADINRALSKKQLSSNPISRAMQKRRIKKDMYARHGVKKGLVERLKIGVKSILRNLNPVYQLQQQLAAIKAIVIGFATAIKVLIDASIILLFIIIPSIAIISVLSLFFNFGGSNTAQIEMAKITTYWSELFCDMRMELIKADKTNSHPGYPFLDEVRLGAGVVANAQVEYRRQIKMLGMVSALYLDELTYDKAKTEIEALFNAVYTVNRNYFNEPYYSDDDDSSPHDWYVLELSIIERDFDAYVDAKLNSILDPDARELALAQYEQYQASFGLGQIYKNPMGDDYDWRNIISSVYGYRIMANEKEKHSGLDIASPTGTPLYSVAEASVIATGYDDTRGNYLILEFPDPGGGADIKVTYMHCDSVSVSSGQTVYAGQHIAYSGNSGRSTGPHLHLEIQKGSDRLNPLLLIEFPSL